jgi:hypothetical protein
MPGEISRTVAARLLPGCALVLFAVIFFWPFFGEGARAPGVPGP